MAQIIRMKTQDGESILVEVDEIKQTLEPISKKPSKEIQSVERIFDRITSDQIVRSCVGILDGFRRLRDFEPCPQRAIAEFGLQFNIEGNAYVVKASTDASIKVTIEWTLAGKPKKKAS